MQYHYHHHMTAPSGALEGFAPSLLPGSVGKCRFQNGWGYRSCSQNGQGFRFCSQNGQGFQFCSHPCVLWHPPAEAHNTHAHKHTQIKLAVNKVSFCYLGLGLFQWCALTHVWSFRVQHCEPENKQIKIKARLTCTIPTHPTQAYSPIFSSIPYFPLYSTRLPFHTDAYLHIRVYVTAGASAPPPLCFRANINIPLRQFQDVSAVDSFRLFVPKREKYTPRFVGYATLPNHAAIFCTVCRTCWGQNVPG